MAATTATIPHLLVRAGGRAYALPVADVVEAMRPLALEPVPRAPAGVAGAAVVRGEVVPVATLAEGDATTGRWVLVRAGARHVVLAVDEVVGLRAIDPGAAGLPPLLHEAGHAGVAGLARLDGELARVLDAARLVPDDFLVEGDDPPARDGGA